VEALLLGGLVRGKEPTELGKGHLSADPLLGQHGLHQGFDLVMLVGKR
jgi:hypothetical protein